MQPNGRLLDKIILENGLTIYIYDQSRPIIGDRAYVELVAHIPIDIEEVQFPISTDSEKDFKDFAAVFSNRICYEKRRVRNFVDKRDVPDTLEQMKQELLEASLPYLNKANFASKYVKMRFHDWVKERRLREAHAGSKYT